MKGTETHTTKYYGSEVLRVDGNFAALVAWGVCPLPGQTPG